MRIAYRFAVAAAFVCLQIGCVDGFQKMQQTWHQKFNWKAEDYFGEPSVVALCHAIEADDLKQIEQLISEGADVNAKGKGAMTPLLWAFPDNKLARFTKILENGANPNIVIESDFNTHGGFHPGDSVTHMACRTEFAGSFVLGNYGCCSEQEGQNKGLNRKGCRFRSHEWRLGNADDASGRLGRPI
jgi:hypothetical protein